MPNLVKLSKNEKWQAVVNCDRNYDGMFFYGVKTTGIFCRPSCRAKTPSPTNVVFFEVPEQAITAGFRPCKKCRPDQVLFEPALELVQKAKYILDRDYQEIGAQRQVAKQLGVSPNHLSRLFKQTYGLTPTNYITRRKVNQAAVLLKQGDMEILEIANVTGFPSLSNFYRCFKEQLGQSPYEYRKSRGDL